MNDEDGGAYAVSFAGKIVDKIRRLEDLAIRLRCSARFKDALDLATQRMSKSPYDWGDPLYRISGISLLVCRGQSDLFYLIYGVHDVEHSVFAIDIFPNPFGPLSGEGYAII